MRLRLLQQPPLLMLLVGAGVKSHLQGWALLLLGSLALQHVLSVT